jgi:hypothetical protein
VEFRLLYSGRLLGANKKNTRAKEKHELRRAFHPQLRHLWSTNRNLDQLARLRTQPWMERHPELDFQAMTNEDFRRGGIEAISYQWGRAGYRFVPLVTDEFSLRCNISILFLRPEEPGNIMQSGDLDARLKTVFDALRIPNNLEEAGGIGPQEDECPFFCLLQDDKLISQVAVTTDQLLVLPRERHVNPNDVFLVIHVELRPIHAGTFDRYF